jgi:hypothetical protein
MNQKQLFEACVLLAPNFRVGIEYTTMPTSDRVLAWHGRRPSAMEEQSSAIPFPEDTAFEPKFFEILKIAYAALDNPQ